MQRYTLTYSLFQCYCSHYNLFLKLHIYIYIYTLPDSKIPETVLAENRLLIWNILWNFTICLKFLYKKKKY